MAADGSDSRDDADLEGFEPVCEIDEVPEIRPKFVEVDDRAILICRSDGGIHAVDEICPHEKKSMRYGVVQRGKIVCPHHQYRFDLETGQCRRRCAPAQVFETRVEEGVVYVRIP